MKPIFKIAFVVVLMFLTGHGYSQTITSNIQVTDPTFLEGLTGFNDTLIADGPSGTTTTNFIIFDDNDDSIGIASTLADGIAVQDMGTLDPAATHIHAVFYDSNGDDLGVSDDYTFAIKARPSWISQIGSDQNGDITLESFDAATGIASLTCNLPLYQKLVEIPNIVWGLGGKEFGVNENKITFSATYDVDNGGVATVDQPSKAFSFQLSAFELKYPNPAYSFPLDSLTSTGLTLDFDPSNNLELLANAQFSRSMNLIRFKSREWKMALPPPLSLIKIGFGVGFNMDGGFSAKALMGEENGAYGFTGDLSTDSVSSVTIGGQIRGTVWGSISLLSKKLAGVEGELWVQGRLGAQYRFKTVPAFEDTVVWGGDLQLGGKLRLTGWLKKGICAAIYVAGGQCGDAGEIIDGNIWPTNNPYPIHGGLPSGLDFGMLVASHANNNSRSVTYENNYMDDALKDLTQQNLCTKGERIGAVWIEEDSSSQRLAFSEMNGTSNVFRQALLVNDTAYGASHPRVGLTGNGSAIIAWAQNKLRADEIDATTTIDSIIGAQEIWFAVYDSSADTITYRSKLYELDDLNDGMPTVTVSDSDKAIISWLAEDPDTHFTDVWVSEVVNENGVWYQGDPQQLTEQDGNNFDVQIAFIDSSHAVATWINDPDGDDSIPGNSIMFAYYDGSAWSAPAAITDPNDEITYQAIAMDFNAGYGALAYTYSDYSDTLNTLNKLTVEIYDVASNTWLSGSEYNYEDSLSDVRLPRITISKGGIVAASFQTVELETDSNFTANHGNINIVAKNLAIGSDWTYIENSQFISDSNVLAWDMDLAFGADDVLYSLTHEIDTVSGNFYQPATGVLFGNPEIGLVLRGMRFTDSLTTDSLAHDSLPQVPTGISPVLQDRTDGLTLKVFPNPTASNTTFEYYIPENGQTRLEVFDMMGRSVAVPVSGMLGQGTYQTYFDPYGLNAGVYLIKLVSGKRSVYYKLVKH